MCLHFSKNLGATKNRCQQCDHAFFQYTSAIALNIERVLLLNIAWLVFFGKSSGAKIKATGSEILF